MWRHSEDGSVGAEEDEQWDLRRRLHKTVTNR